MELFSYSKHNCFLSYTFTCLYIFFTEASSSKRQSSGSKLLIVPRDLPYLRQTNARRVIFLNISRIFFNYAMGAKRYNVRELKIFYLIYLTPNCQCVFPQC